MESELLEGNHPSHYLHPATWPIVIAILLQQTLEFMSDAVLAPGVVLWYGDVREYQLKDGTFRHCPEPAARRAAWPEGTVEWYTRRNIGLVWPNTKTMPRRHYPFANSQELMGILAYFCAVSSAEL